jgi:phosphofructokinase-like protein
MSRGKIGIVTSGGDCAGLNAVISSVVRSGTLLGYEFIGFERGWEGMLTPLLYRPLSLDSVRGISHLGGTILRTSNKGRFGAKVGDGETARIPDEVLQEAKTHLDELGVDGLIVLGGDGSLTAAMQLAELGVKIIGVPKTIDNDLNSTDRTFGFSTAVQVAMEAIDKVHTTAASHERVIIVECMGRNAGWLALGAGLAAGAHAILIPEISFKVDDLIAFLRERVHTGRTSSIVVIAEGVRINGVQESHGTAGGSMNLLGGVSHLLMREIEKRAEEEFEMRTVVLGHIQRGGSPNAEDRILAKRYGVAAMQAYDRGEFGSMVALHGSEMVAVPILDAVGEPKGVTVDAPEFKAAKGLGIFIE